MSLARKAAVLLLVAVVALGTASVALGKFTKGIYRSKPPAGRVSYVDFSFTATAAKAKTFRFTYRKPGACTDGHAAVGDETAYRIPAAAINSAGRFAVHLTVGDSKLDIAGKVSGRKASGTLRDRFSVGAVRCDTTAMSWKAFHLG
ncbi:MAG: hypothetical protein U0R52_00405 [Solirubrobacterales bacterium]